MRLGFTGSQHGMSRRQQEVFRYLLHRLRVDEFHHGDCVGADAEADAIVRALGIKIVIHPPIDESRRAYCGDPSDPDTTTEWREPRYYLDRNHDIVRESDALVATPETDAEVLRSGTWATVRFARETNVPVSALKR